MCIFRNENKGAYAATGGNNQRFGIGEEKSERKKMSRSILAIHFYHFTLAAGARRTLFCFAAIECRVFLFSCHCVVIIPSLMVPVVSYV